MDKEEIIKQLNIYWERVRDYSERARIFGNRNPNISAVLILILIVGVGLLLREEYYPIPGENRLKPPVETIDPVSRSPLGVDVSDGAEQERIDEAPRLVLELPPFDSFSPERINTLAGEFGFTDDAEVLGTGTVKLWREGIKLLSVNSQSGEINYSVDLATIEGELPLRSISHNEGKQVIQSFFENTSIDTTYFDLNNMEYQFMTIDEYGGLQESSESVGTMLKIAVPYTVSGVPLLLPTDTSFVIDGNGVIRTMKLYVPYLRQVGRFDNLLSWKEAEKQAERGGGVFIELKNPQSFETESDSHIPTLEFTNSIFAYYVNQGTFYAYESQRELTPVYIFSGEQGKVAVPLRNENE